MSKIVNLRQARKQRDRAVKKSEADANVAMHGRSKAARMAEDREAAKAVKHLDDHKRDKP